MIFHTSQQKIKEITTGKLPEKLSEYRKILVFQILLSGDKLSLKFIKFDKNSFSLLFLLFSLVNFYFYISFKNRRI